MAFDLVGKAVKKLRLPTVDYQGSQPCVIPAQQGDKNSRYLKVTLYDDNGDINIKQYRSVRLNATLPDNSSQYSDGEISDDGNYVICQIDGSLLSLVGTVECDVKLEDAYDNGISSKKFYINVHESQFSNSSIRSSQSNTSNIDILLSKTEYISSIVNIANDAIEISDEIKEIDTSIPILNREIDIRLKELEDSLLSTKESSAEKCGQTFFVPHDKNTYAVINKVGCLKSSKIQSWSRENIIPVKTYDETVTSNGLTCVWHENSNEVVMYGSSPYPYSGITMAFCTIGSVYLEAGVTYLFTGCPRRSSGDNRIYKIKFKESQEQQFDLYYGDVKSYTPKTSGYFAIQFIAYSKHGDTYLYLDKERYYGSNYGDPENIIFTPNITKVGSSHVVIDEYVMPTEVSSFNNGYVDFDCKKYYDSSGSEFDIGHLLTNYDTYNFIKTQPGGNIVVLDNYDKPLDVSIQVTYMAKK